MFRPNYLGNSSNGELLYNNNGVIDGTTGITYDGNLSLADDVTLSFSSTETRTIGYSSSTTNWSFTGNSKFIATMDSEYPEGMENNFTVTGSSGARTGLLFSLSGPYNGGSLVTGINFDVTVANCTSAGYNTDTSLYSYRPNGIWGGGGFSRSVTSAIRAGWVVTAGGSNKENYALWAAATVTRTGAQNVAVLGAAQNLAGTEFGVAAVLGTRTTKPITRSTSAALLADNSTLDKDIAVFMHNGVDVFKTDNNGLTNVLAGTSTAFARVGGVLDVNTTNVGNVGTGEDDLMTHTIPANTLAVDGDFVEFEAGGTTSSTETVKVYFGSTAILTHTFSGGSPKDFSVRGRVIRTGATTQKATVQLVDGGGSNIDTEVTLPTETLSGSVVLKLTGQGTNDDDIIQKDFIIKWYPHN